MELNNTSVFITGGSSGIGKATAQLFVSRGAKVVITGRDKSKLEQVAKEIGAIPLHFDVSDLTAISANADAAIKLLGGRLDVLINNAGIGTFSMLGDISEADFTTVFTTNVYGLTMLTQAMLPTFKAQQFGTIINIGSSAAVKGFARGSVYAASKFAVRALSQCWQAELRKDNIRVCLINPSEVTTAFASEERIEREEESKKLGAEDIANAIVSVCEMRDKGFVPELSVWATNPF